MDRSQKYSKSFCIYSPFLEKTDNEKQSRVFTPPDLSTQENSRSNLSALLPGSKISINENEEEYVDMKLNGWQRFVILAIACFMKFATYYIVTTPGSIQQELIRNYRISNVEFGMLYSVYLNSNFKYEWVYSIPNIFLSLVTGIIIDRIGVRKSTVLFTLFPLLGQLIFAISPYIQSYDLALLGRFILGIATESQGVAIVIFINHWFEHKEIGFACAIMITIAKAGVSLTNYLTPVILVSSGSLTIALFFGVGLTVLSFSLSLIYAKLDSYNQRRVELQRQLSSFKLLQHQQDEIQSNQGFMSMKFLRELKPKFWVFSLVCMLAYCTYGPYQNNVSMLLRARFQFDILQAGEIMAYMAIVSTALAPFIGYASDKINKRIEQISNQNEFKEII